MREGTIAATEPEVLQARLENQCQTLRDAWESHLKQGEPESLGRFGEAAAALSEMARQQDLARISELALMLEVMCGPVLDGQEAETTEFQETVSHYLNTLADQCRQALCGPTAPAAPVAQVLMLAEHGALNDAVEQHLAHFGYELVQLSSVEAMERRLRRSAPRAVMLDPALLGGAEGVIRLAEKLRERLGEQLPILLVTDAPSMDSRLAAARAGLTAYLVKPVAFDELLDLLELFHEDHQPEPYRVLVVEDSPTQARYISTVLERAGMDVIVVRNPMEVLETLEARNADLILTDMYMPDCTGYELASVIRQIPRHASIPIVYLSGETKLDRQLRAMSRGGDDFLTKPIEPDHLVQAVSIRAERGRMLRGMMVTDGLTGLLNHTRIKEELEAEVARAQRRGSVVSFAMLDLDYFKGVNDTFGHPAGDRVIKTLAGLLRQRLRRTDSIGRYGGEEFAVIMPDATMEQALRVLDGIRQRFADIRHAGPEGPFRVTFSAGVACYPDCSDATQLTMEADTALYAAKRAGRNCIRAGRPNGE